MRLVPYRKSLTCSPQGVLAHGSLRTASNRLSVLVAYFVPQKHNLPTARCDDPETQQIPDKDTAGAESKVKKQNSV